VAFVPGAGAFLDGRGHNAMRLNFSGSDDDAIREGIRRIGKVVEEQVDLYGTLTGRDSVGPSSAAAEEDRARNIRFEDQADVVELPRREDRDKRAQ